MGSGRAVRAHNEHAMKQQRARNVDERYANSLDVQRAALIVVCLEFSKALWTGSRDPFVESSRR
jgi:hypothetical protein